MKKVILSICLMVVLLSCSMAQNQKSEGGNSFKNAKVYLVSGEVIITKNISIQNSELLVLSKSSLSKSYSLNEVKEVKIPTKKNIRSGAIVGAITGTGVMLLFESIYEKPKTTYESGPGWTRTTTITREMPNIEKIPFVIGGTTLGALIGSAIKSGWKQIYPNNNMTFGLSFQNDFSNQPVFSLTLNF